MLRDMEAADARGELPSDDEAADWAAAEPAGGHGGRMSFGGGAAQQQHHLVSTRKQCPCSVLCWYNSIVVSYGRTWAAKQKVLCILIYAVY